MSEQDEEDFFIGLSSTERRDEVIKMAQASMAFKTLRELCNLEPDFMSFILAVVARTMTDAWSTSDPERMKDLCVRGMSALAKETRERINNRKEEGTNGTAVD